MLQILQISPQVVDLSCAVIPIHLNMKKSTLTTGLLLTIVTCSSAQQFCNIYCDGRDPDLAEDIREAASVEVHFRQIRLRFSDIQNMGFAVIENGDPGDEVWLDRSIDGGVSWAEGSKLGDTFIPEGSRGTSTLMYNVDQPSTTSIGALRACGKAGDRPEIACTSWFRSTVRAQTPIEAGATAMMQFYTDDGLWKTTGWWNSANCLTAIIDFTDLTPFKYYEYAIDRTFERNKDGHWGNFTNEYIDDTLWWGLAFVRAYDVTGDQKYLEMAKFDSDFCYEYKDNVCGGGLWWTTDRTYKNAIPNELFIKLAAALHSRIPGDTKYLNQALEVWNWFRFSGMFNSDHLINDGLTSDCRNNGQVTWTYNQGVILGGLVELAKGTGIPIYLEEARLIADAVIRSTYLNDQNGILHEPCEHDGCGGDGPSFKGIFMRNLGELNRALAGQPYSEYLQRQVDSIYGRTRNQLNQFGLNWAGPFDMADAARQHSAFEAFISAIV